MYQRVYEIDTTKGDRDYINFAPTASSGEVNIEVVDPVTLAVRDDVGFKSHPGGFMIVDKEHNTLVTLVRCINCYAVTYGIFPVQLTLLVTVEPNDNEFL